MTLIVNKMLKMDAYIVLFQVLFYTIKKSGKIDIW